MTPLTAQSSVFHRYSGFSGPNYAPLMSVWFRHSFYNLGTDVVRLLAQPTARSASLMQSLGLLLRQNPNGFSVLYDTSRQDSLRTYLKTQQNSSGGLWARLSISLIPQGDDFIVVTDMPIETRCSASNFYFSNQTAHRAGDDLLLSATEWANETPLLPTTSSQRKIILANNNQRVLVTSVSGAAAPIPCTLGDTSLGAKGVGPAPPFSTYLDFSTVREGVYDVCVMEDGERKSRQRLIYSLASPTPIAFLNLFFVSPTADSAGVYPIGRDPSATHGLSTPAGVDYVLNIRGRSIVWRYNIATQDSGGDLEDLTIEPVSPGPTVTFKGPTPVQGATGASTYSFVSDAAVPLQQISNVRLRLNGRITGAMTAAGVLSDCLPIAGPSAIVAKPQGPEAVMRVYV